ncbi:MAG TPA: hypothetical protein VF707_17275 [Ardenticatenaceae bacterium]
MVGVLLCPAYGKLFRLAMLASRQRSQNGGDYLTATLLIRVFSSGW